MSEHPSDLPQKPPTSADAFSISATNDSEADVDINVDIDVDHTDEAAAIDDIDDITDTLRAKADVALHSEFERKRQQINLEEYKREIDFQRKIRIAQLLLGNSVGVILLSTGIFFTYKTNMIGPYMMGLGAATAGFSLKETAAAVHLLPGSDTRDQEP